MSETGNDEKDKNNNNNSLPIFSQVQFVFAYGSPNSFQNILKRDVNLKGDEESDIDSILRNFVDFTIQMNYDPLFVAGYLTEIIEDIVADVDTDFDDEMYGEEDDEEGLFDPNHNSVIKVGEKVYEDVDDIVSDDDSFNRFVEQFNKEDNLLLRKIVFRAYLKYIVGERPDEGE